MFVFGQFLSKLWLFVKWLKKIKEKCVLKVKFTYPSFFKQYDLSL